MDYQSAEFFGNTKILYLYEQHMDKNDTLVMLSPIISQLGLRDSDRKTHPDDPFAELCYILPLVDFNGDKIKSYASKLKFLNAFLFRIKHWTYKGYQSELIKRFQYDLCVYLMDILSVSDSEHEWKRMFSSWNNWQIKENNCIPDLRLLPLKKEINVDEPVEQEFGYVYVIKSDNLYKIGKSRNLSTRISSLQTSCPNHLTLIHSIKSPDYSNIEKKLHEKFNLRRKKGEWFELCDEDLEDIVSGNFF